jgi:hypothetical protein
MATRLTNTEMERVKEMSIVGCSARETRALIDRPGIDKVRIYNARAKFRRERINGRGKMDVLLDELDSDQYASSFKVNEEDGRVSHFFFARRDALAWFSVYPYVLMLDCTYKTNRYTFG